VIEKWIERGEGGSITMLTSFHVHGTYPGRLVYANSKAAISQMAKALCCDYARDGIRVNALALGQVEGPRTDSFGDLDDMKARSPAGKLVDNDDIYCALCMLMGCKAINGQTITADHGVTASLWHQPYEPHNEEQPTDE